MILNAASGCSHHGCVKRDVMTPPATVDTYSLLADAHTPLLARGCWDAMDRTQSDYGVPVGSMSSAARDTGVSFSALASSDDHRPRVTAGSQGSDRRRCR